MIKYGKKWSEEEDSLLLRLHEKTKGRNCYKVIAKEIGRTPIAVRLRIRKLLFGLCVVWAMATPVQAQSTDSTLNALGIEKDRWADAIIRLAYTDTLICPQTKSKMYRSGQYGDHITYEVKGKVFEMPEADVLKWVYRRRENN